MLGTKFLVTIKNSKTHDLSVICHPKSMNQLFYNIAGGIVHQIRRDFWRSDLLTLSACTIGIWSTLTYTEFDCAALLAML